MKIITRNKKARFDYHIIETYEAGVVLKGWEVKSVRQGKVSLTDAYAQVVAGEVYLYNMHISPYDKAREESEPKRERKLLLNKREIEKIHSKLRNKGLTLIPLKVYIKRGLVKITLSVAKGKKKYEKREKIIEKEQKREIEKYL